MGRTELPKDVRNIVDLFLKAGKNVVGYQLESDSGTGHSKLVLKFGERTYQRKTAVNTDEKGTKYDFKCSSNFRAQDKYKSPAKRSRDRTRFSAWLEKRFSAAIANSNSNKSGTDSRSVNVADSVRNHKESVITEIETDLKLLPTSSCDANRSVSGSSLVDPNDIVVNTNLEVEVIGNVEEDAVESPPSESSMESDAQGSSDDENESAVATEADLVVSDCCDAREVCVPAVEQLLGQIWQDFDDGGNAQPSTSTSTVEVEATDSRELNNISSDSSLDIVPDTRSSSLVAAGSSKKPKIKKVVHDTRDSMYRYVADVDDGTLIVFNELDGSFEVLRRDEEAKEDRIKDLVDVLESSVDVIGPMNVFRFIMSDVWE